jgi:hypothetical protein
MSYFYVSYLLIHFYVSLLAPWQGSLLAPWQGSLLAPWQGQTPILSVFIWGCKPSNFINMYSYSFLSISSKDAAKFILSSVSYQAETEVFDVLVS